MTPSNFLATLRPQIDSALALCLEDARRRYAAVAAEEIVDEVIRATLPKGGRLRPLLCCLGYAAVGGEGGPADSRIIKAAASIELLHTFAIVHDDVMDGSPMRRGEPSIHRRLADERAASGGRDAELHGISLAILAGDLALVLSDLLFAQSGFPREALVQAYEPLSAMRLDAIAGQFLDLTHSGEATHDSELSTLISNLKTSSYSVEGPILVGATLGGGSADSIEVLRSFARPMGEAFQLADDLLGLFGDPAVTGKDAENDIRRGKPTPLIAHAMTMADPPTRSRILEVWGNPKTSEKDLDGLREAVRSSGAAAKVTAGINRLVLQASAALESADRSGLVPSTCRLLSELAQAVSERVTSEGMPED